MKIKRKLLTLLALTGAVAPVVLATCNTVKTGPQTETDAERLAREQRERQERERREEAERARLEAERLERERLEAERAQINDTAIEKWWSDFGQYNWKDWIRKNEDGELWRARTPENIKLQISTNFLAHPFVKKVIEDVIDYINESMQSLEREAMYRFQFEINFRYVNEEEMTSDGFQIKPETKSVASGLNDYIHDYSYQLISAWIGIQIKNSFIVKKNYNETFRHILHEFAHLLGGFPDLYISDSAYQEINLPHHIDDLYLSKYTVMHRYEEKRTPKRSWGEFDLFVLKKLYGNFAKNNC